MPVVKKFSQKAPLNKKNHYNCPNCGAQTISDGSEQSTKLEQTKPEFVHAPDPHYKWQELHKCHMCETLFRITNGT